MNPFGESKHNLVSHTETTVVTRLPVTSGQAVLVTITFGGATYFAAMATHSNVQPPNFYQ